MGVMNSTSSYRLPGASARIIGASEPRVFGESRARIDGRPPYPTRPHPVLTSLPRRRLDNYQSQVSLQFSETFKHQLRPTFQSTLIEAKKLAEEMAAFSGFRTLTMNAMLSEWRGTLKPKGSPSA